VKFLTDLLARNIFVLSFVVLAVIAANIFLLVSIRRRGELGPVFQKLFPWLTNSSIVTLISASISSVALILVMAPTFKELVYPPGPEGHIVRPVDGEEVGSQFGSQVLLRSIPSDAYVWLMVQRQDYFWPKLEVTRALESTLYPIYEGGVPGELHLVLVLLDKNQHSMVLEWLDRGLQTDHFPGLPRGTSWNILDTVSLRLK
jgi:hypothetical protein